MLLYPNLFKKGKLGKITTKNRIVMSPMGDEMANADGSISDQAIAYFTERAKGGTGVIIPGVLCVDYPAGKTVASQNRIDGAKYVKNLERLASSVHRYGALIIPQLHHAGLSTDKETSEGCGPVRISAEETVLSEEDNKLLIGSKPDILYASQVEKILTNEDIKELEQKFITAAKYTQMAGCDGIELHGGPHYLIGNFLNPHINNRTDEYGGSLENRIRFPVNIIRGIRESCGPNFIIGIRMTVYWDNEEDNTIMAKAYESAGADFLDCNMPANVTKQSQIMETQGYPQGARLVLAKNIMGKVTIPVFANGNLREPDFCEKALADGSADYIALGRPLLADPDWANKAKAGKSNEIRKCISCCDGCAGALSVNQIIRCVLNPELGRELEMKTENITTNPKKVVIVGGGIGGMQAAITAATRGHNVTLLEKTDKLGGQLHLASVPPNKKVINWATDWFVGEVKRSPINVQFRCDADENYIESLKPDAVIIATGAKPVTPNIPGVEHAIQSWDILSGAVESPMNRKVTIIGGGIVGCETASFLEAKGNKVTVLEMLPNIATGLYILIKMEMLDEFKEKGIATETQTCVKEIKANEVIYEKEDTMHRIETDMVVLAVGQSSCGQSLFEQLEESGIDVTIIGDAKKPAKIIDATRDGMFAALDL